MQVLNCNVMDNVSVETQGPPASLALPKWPSNRKQFLLPNILPFQCHRRDLLGVHQKLGYLTTSHHTGHEKIEFKELWPRSGCTNMPGSHWNSRCSTWRDTPATRKGVFAEVPPVSPLMLHDHSEDVSKNAILHDSWTTQSGKESRPVKFTTNSGPTYSGV